MSKTWYAVRTQTRLIRPATDIRDEDERRDENNRFIQVPRIRGELAVERDLQAMGIEAVCPIQIEFKRKAKDRRPEPYETPYLPGYIFAAIPAYLFRDAMQVKGIGSDLMMVHSKAERALHSFLRKVETERLEAQCIHAEGDLAAIHGFKAGQAIELLGDAFLGQLATFKGIVKSSGDQFAKVQFSMPMFGGDVSGECRLEDVRKAG